MYQRTEQGFVRTDYTGLDAIISLTELDIVLPLAELYYSVDFEQAQMLSSDD